jgi:hypothetical protein
LLERERERERAALETGETVPPFVAHWQRLSLGKRERKYWL